MGYLVAYAVASAKTKMFLSGATAAITLLCTGTRSRRRK